MQAAIAGALLAHRTGPDVFTTNQITSALVPQTRTRRLLSYCTIAQVPRPSKSAYLI